MLVMQQNKISVIMGVHNSNDCLEEAINSIINQTYKNWEFIICDDGSTNDTKAKLEKYKNDKRFIIISNKKNEGLPKTLNNCLAYCTGKYVARMDDDDISYPERFSRQVEFLEKHPNVSFVSSSIDIYDGNKIVGKRILKEFPTKNNLIWNSPFVHPATMFVKDDLLLVNGYRVAQETLRGQDYDLFMRMYGKGFLGANITQPLYRYTVANLNLKRRTWKARKGEIKIRIHGYKSMHVLWYAWPFLLKPVFAHIATIFKIKR